MLPVKKNVNLNTQLLLKITAFDLKFARNSSFYILHTKRRRKHVKNARKLHVSSISFLLIKFIWNEIYPIRRAKRQTLFLSNFFILIL